MSDYELTIELAETGEIVEIQFDPSSRTEFRSTFSPDGHLTNRLVQRVRMNPIPILKHKLIQSNVSRKFDK